jgi:hypothetical protein
MASSIFLQNTIFTSFILPFFLIWLVTFAILQRTKLLGESKGQLDALVSLIVGFIFIAAFNYSAVINNLVLFLSISMVVIFVGLLLWGFVSGENSGFSLKDHPAFRNILLIALFIAVIIGVIWAFGIPLTQGQGSVANLLFNQVWSQPFWTNLIFIILIGLALALVIGRANKSK